MQDQRDFFMRSQELRSQFPKHQNMENTQRLSKADKPYPGAFVFEPPTCRCGHCADNSNILTMSGGQVPAMLTRHIKIPPNTEMVTAKADGHRYGVAMADGWNPAEIHAAFPANAGSFTAHLRDGGIRVLRTDAEFTWCLAPVETVPQVKVPATATPAAKPDDGKLWSVPAGVPTKRRGSLTTLVLETQLLDTLAADSAIGGLPGRLVRQDLVAFLVDPEKAPLVNVYTAALRARLVGIVEAQPNCERLAAIVKVCSPLLLLYVGSQICPELTTMSKTINRLPFYLPQYVVDILKSVLPRLIEHWSLERVLGTSLAKFLQPMLSVGLDQLRALASEQEFGTCSFAGGNADILCAELELKCKYDKTFNDRCIRQLKARFRLPQGHCFFTVKDLTSALNQYKRAIVSDIPLAWMQEPDQQSNGASETPAVNCMRL